MIRDGNNISLMLVDSSKWEKRELTTLSLFIHIREDFNSIFLNFMNKLFGEWCDLLIGNESYQFLSNPLISNLLPPAVTPDNKLGW